jgi:hypothetical protein
MPDRFNELLSKLEQQISKSLAEARAMQAEPFERSRDVETRFDMVSPTQDYEIPILRGVSKQYGADLGDGTAGISSDADSRLTDLANPEFSRQPASEQTVLDGASPLPRFVSASGNDPRAALTIEKPQLASSSTQTDTSGGSEEVNARIIQVQAQSSDLPLQEEASESPMPEANSPSYTPPPPQLQVETATGQEDIPLDLSKFVEIGSGNHGGTLTVTISGLPDGASFSAGVEVAPGIWLFTEAELDGLILNPPADSDASFTLHVIATLTDAGGNSATRSVQFNVHLDAVADQPLINLAPGSGPGVAGIEDQTIALDLEAALTDTDGSETLSITLYGMPAGATLSAGTHNADGSWTLTPGQLAGLTMNAPANFNGDFTLHVEATATEGSNGDTATTLFELPVHVAPVNDAPTNLTVDGLTVAENAAGAIIGDVSTVDPDADDTINYTVSDSRFEVADGQLKLKDGVSFNYEAEHSVNLRVTGTDSGGLSTFKDVTVQVTDVNEAPTDLNFSSTGISMNVDGGNNSYFKIADQGDLVGGLKQMTIEIQFSGSKVLSAWDYMNLFSYHIGKGSDEIEIALDNNDNGIDFTIEIGNSYTEFKNFDAYGLLDGGVHQVSLTWDSTNGAVNIYADGVLVGSKTGIATGHTIGTGGVITLGQEQDKLEGGFDPTQNFKGAYHDVRIFNDVRTATEISENVLKDVSTTEQGLVADWRMNELTDGKTYDAVSGKDLTAMHVSGAGWIDSTPKHVAIITELSPNGTVVTTMQGIDPDTGDTLTYSVENDPSGLFEVVGNEVRVKNGAGIVFENQQSHELVLKVTDSAGHSYSEPITVRVTNINQAPTEPSLTGSTVAENAAGAVIGKVTATDLDLYDKLHYTVSDSRFEVVNGDLKLKSGVSLDYEAEPSINLTITTVDAGGLTSASKDFTITVNNVNDAPGAVSITNSTVAENAPGAIVGHLSSIDQDAGDSVTYTVNDSRFEVVNGDLKLKTGTSLNYESTKSVTVKVTATDTSGAAKTTDIKVNVTNVNEAPTTPTLSKTSIAENLVGGVVGTVAATDPDAGDTLTFSVDDSRFEIVSGQLKLKDGVSLDYEAVKTIPLKITATDAGGLSTVKSVTLSVTNVNEAPGTPSLSNQSVAENAAGAVIGTVASTDPDAGDTVNYTVNDNRFEIVGGQLKLKSGISLNYETEPSVTLKVTAADAGGLSSSKDFAIGVTNVNEAPTDLTFINNAAASSNVLALNNGATTQYAQIGNFSAFPTNAVTVEMRFTGINPPPEPTLFSYNVPGGDNEFLIIEQSGVLRVSVNGTSVSTGVGHSALFDGGQHMLSVSWEKQTGALKVYVDGVQKFSGSISAGVPISAGGTLVVGQEQDVVGGGFTGSQIFKGTIDEIRIFDDVRTAQEISANATTKLASPASEQGLISNWQMNAGGAGIVDESGNHRDLSLKNGAALQAVIHKGAVMGQITSVADPDSGDSFTYSLQSDPSGLFEIIGSEVRLKADAPVQIGNPQTYNLTVKVTDAGGNSYSEIVSVQLADTNDAPNVPSLSGNTVAENAAGATVGTVSATDPDIGDNLSYSVNDSRFEAVNGTLKLKAGVSLNHESEPSVSVKVTATDSGGLSSHKDFTINVTNVNEAPVATAVQGQFALRGAGFTMETAQAFNDPDAGDHLTYTINGPAWMQIDATTGQITGTPPVAYSTLTMTNGVYTPATGGEVHIDTQILSSYAGYHNSMGYYIADANGNPIAGRLLDKDALDLGNSHSEINLANYPGAVSIGFFLLPDAGSSAWAVGEGGDVSFVKVGNAWNVVWGAGGENSTAVFSNTSLNSDGLAHLVDNATTGAMNWEDIIGGGDADFNDINMNATVHSYSEPTSVVKQVTVTATDASGLATSTTFSITVADERVDTIQGTSYADTILGGDAGDTIYGNAGDDTLTGGAGADLIYGDDGDDALSGDAGDDSLHGDIGNDSFDGGTGNDFHYGGEGGDMFLYAKGSGADNIFGGGGQGWLDTVHITGVSSGLDATGHGVDWTLQIENGSILSADAGSLTLSQDADGSIVFNDGTSVAFHDIEKIEWN